MDKTVPTTAEERRAARQANLPGALSETQLQRVSVGRVRYALSQLAQNNVTAVQGWLDAVSVTDGPAKALELYLKLLEYSIPKLSRTEVHIEDNAGGTALDSLSFADLQEMVQNGVKDLIKQEALKQQGTTIEGEAQHVENHNA